MHRQNCSLKTASR